jgi:hypothetical protein
MLIAPIMGASNQSSLAEPLGAAKVNSLAIESASLSTEVPAVEESDMNELSPQMDPLDSPYPVPWNWMMATYEDISSKSGSGVRYYRSQSLVSPDGLYAAYSRVQMQVQSQLYNSRVSSVMFVENLQTGELRVITATSPLADNPLVASEDADMPGTISVLVPVGWSETGELLLARQFEGLFNTTDATDYAVIWDRQQNRTSTVAPSQDEYSHDISVLLGWSKTQPGQVLFSAGNLGDEEWPLWAVRSDGTTLAATPTDQPIVFGQQIQQLWGGPQVAYR